MNEWFLSIVDNGDKRANLSVIVGVISVILGPATFFISFLFYPVSALLAAAAVLMGYTSLESNRGWHAIAGMVLGGIGLLAPLIFLAVMLFSPAG